MTPPILETDRLTLRPAEVKDFRPAAESWGDPDVVRYIGGKARTPQEVWFAMLRGRAMWDLKGFGYWTVVERATGAWLGEVGFADFKRGLDPDLSQWPEAGWVIGKAAWGRGIASEAVLAAHAWLDQAAPGTSVCIIDTDNAASRRVAEKCGYAYWCAADMNGSPVNVFRRPGPV